MGKWVLYAQPSYAHSKPTRLTPLLLDESLTPLIPNSLIWYEVAGIIIDESSKGVAAVDLVEVTKQLWKFLEGNVTNYCEQIRGNQEIWSERKFFAFITNRSNQVH